MLRHKQHLVRLVQISSLVATEVDIFYSGRLVTPIMAGKVQNISFCHYKHGWKTIVLLLLAKTQLEQSYCVMTVRTLNSSRLGVPPPPFPPPADEELINMQCEVHHFKNV